MANNPLISVIVPVYKVEPYLRRCIDSIIAQTYTNLEIILVDDGSPDNCGKICDEYAAKDSRIKVIHKENGGVSVARNYGIDSSNGDYIVFIDSDDFVREKHIENLLNCIETYSADIAISTYKLMSEIETECNIRMYNNNRPICIDKLTAVEQIMYQRISGAPWGKIFNKKIFQKLRFPKDITIAEDLYTVYHALLNASKISYCNDSSYIYILRKDSADSHVFNKKKIYSIYYVINDLYINKEHLKDIWRAVECRIVDLLFHVFMMMPKGNELIPSVWVKIEELRKHVIPNPNARFKTRLACFLSFLGQDAVRNIFSYINKRK